MPKMQTTSTLTPQARPNVFLLAALGWIGLVAAFLLSDLVPRRVSAYAAPPALPAVVAQTQAAMPEVAAAEVVTTPAPALAVTPLAVGGQAPAPAAAVATPFPFEQIEGDQTEIGQPYAHWVLTQGPHSFDAGQAALDLSAGHGAEVLSPINGIVTQLYVDWVDNTTLVIENQNYQVTILHGLYNVQVGDRVRLGQVVGTESNQGNTRDAYGNSCRGRDCGYHSHLNIFDKNLGSNLNLLDVIGRGR